MNNATVPPAGPHPGRDAAVLATLGVAQTVATVAAARVVGHGETYPLFLLAYLAMGLPWLAACHYAFTRASSTRANRFLVLGFAVAMRLVFLATEPVLSDDIFRYLWDGRVQHAGINPYRFTPDDPALAGLRAPAGEASSIYAGINNKDIPTIYPPFLQEAFYAVTAISERIVWMKALFVVSDLAIVFVLFGLLGGLGLSSVRVVAYAWSPLVIVEVAGSGHNDALAVLCAMSALWLIVQQRDTLAMAALALSGAGKLVGFALAPLFVREARLRALLVIPLTAIVVSLPYAGAGTLAFRGLVQYGTRWRGNDGLFHLLYLVTGSLDRAKVVVAVILVVLVLALVAAGVTPLRGVYVTLGAILLLMTTVHPWYLLWIAPFLAIYSSPSWLYLSLAVALSYHSAYLSTPGAPWEDVSWVKLLEYGPFFALAGWGAFRRARRGVLRASSLG